MPSRIIATCCKSSLASPGTVSDDIYRSFWEIAIPVLAVVIIVTLWGDFHRMFHRIKKRYFYEKVTR
jgi:hypothetical protein